MIPAKVPQTNCSFIAPPDLDEAQCGTIEGFQGQVFGGSCDGLKMIVVAYRPSPEELEEIIKGSPIFLTCIGGLMPHYLSTNFHTATHPA